MKNWIIVILLMFIVGCDANTYNVTALDSVGKSNDVPEQKLAEIIRLGREIYLKDQFAAAATDIVLQEVNNPDPKVKGWIIVPNEDKWTVKFIKQNEESLVPVYEVCFGQSAKPRLRIVKGGVLSVDEKAMFKARQLALSVVSEPCSENYNTIVVSGKDNSCWYAYALSASEDTDVIVVGGHYRVTVSRDGETLIKSRRFSKSCLNLKSPSQAQGVDKPIPFMSQLLDDTPVETHVYLSLLHRTPLYVVAGEKVWEVTGSKIRLLEQ